jgi:hypothetical protein
MHIVFLYYYYYYYHYHHHHQRPKHVTYGHPHLCEKRKTNISSNVLDFYQRVPSTLASLIMLTWRIVERRLRLRICSISSFVLLMFTNITQLCYLMMYRYFCLRQKYGRH